MVLNSNSALRSKQNFRKKRSSKGYPSVECDATDDVSKNPKLRDASLKDFNMDSQKMSRNKSPLSVNTNTMTSKSPKSQQKSPKSPASPSAIAKKLVKSIKHGFQDMHKNNSVQYSVSTKGISSIIVSPTSERIVMGTSVLDRIEVAMKECEYRDDDAHVEMEVEVELMHVLGTSSIDHGVNNEMRDEREGLINNHTTPVQQANMCTRRSTIEMKNTFLERNKPVAGSTSVQVKDENDHDEIRGEKISWMAAEPSLIQLRGQDYLKTKRKNPSATSLYELVEMDIFHSDEHLTDVGCRFQLPPNDFKDLEHCWRAPDILIISFSLPTSAPKLGRVTTDKKGLIVCGYYQIRKEVRKTLEIVSNARLNDVEKEEALNLLFKDQDSRLLVKGVLLWEKWCATSANDPDMQKRLKFIPRGENLRELKVPSWICRYNGKPLLIKRPGETSFIFSHPGERMMEIDINLHTFPYMFKQAMTYLNDHYFVRMLMTFGFVIEGRSEEELPEVLLGNPMSIRVDPAKLKNIFTILNARGLS